MECCTKTKHELKIHISVEQLQTLENASNVDILLETLHERKWRVNVMSHICALGDQCQLRTQLFIVALNHVISAIMLMWYDYTGF